jgi:hypothetical protein
MRFSHEDELRVRNSYKFVIRIPEEIDLLGHPGADERIILKCIVKE